MRIVTRLLVGVVVLVLCAVGAVAARSAYRLSRTITVPRPNVALSIDSVTLARGRHLATAIGKCGDCHGENFGGSIFVDDKALGRFVAPNLTRGKGGIGTVRSDAELAAAIRHGIAPNGRALIFMPSAGFSAFSRSDLTALISWIRSRPAVDNVLPESKIGPVGRLLLGLGQPLIDAEKIDHDRVTPDSIPETVSVGYGAYLATVGGCIGCHNPALSGGHVPGTPTTFKDAANLTRGGLPDWTLGDFRRLLREGRTPQGATVDSFMPWRYTRLMSDNEIEAVWLYARSLPARSYGKQ